MKKPYLIRTPQFDVTSGGIRVMYGLYGWLLAKGQIVYLNAMTDVPAIGIYPEIYHGNDMGASKVVRYVLAELGTMATGGIPGPTVFPKDDEIYVFSKVYDQWDVDDDHILFLPIIDLHTFRDQGKKRTKTAFYCARGKNLNKHPKNAVEITREFAADQQALADLLNECKKLYVYDKITAMLEVSRLCGTPVEYWGDTPFDVMMKYEPKMNGIVYEGLVTAWNPVSFRKHYKDMIDIFSKRLDRFIEHTQEL